MMIDNLNSDNRIYTLEDWELVKKYCDYIAYGRVYNNRKFINGHRIHTSPVIRFETGETEYYIHTLNSVYLLPMDSYIGSEDMQKFFTDIETHKARAFACAEKLLSEGDCLFSEYNVFYRTSEGVISLDYQKIPHQYVSYKYEKDGFELCAYSAHGFDVSFNASYSNCALYEISFFNNSFKKSDYKCCNSIKNHNLQEVQCDQSVPF